MLDMHSVKYGACAKKNVFMVLFEHVTSPEYKERYRRLDPLRTASIRKADRCQSLKCQQDQALRYLLIAF